MGNYKKLNKNQTPLKTNRGKRLAFIVVNKSLRQITYETNNFLTSTQGHPK